MSIMPGCIDTHSQSISGENTVPSVSSNVDADTASRLWLQLQQNTVVLRLSVSHINIIIEYQLANMFTKSLAEESSQAVNKSPTHYPCDSARTFRVILFSIHNDEWKSFQCHHQTALRRPYALSWKPCQGDSLNLPDHRIHKDGDGDASFQLKSDSLPHAHAQTTKKFYKHQDSRIMKAQELKTKTSAQTLIYKIFLQRYQVYQGRLLASFQDDAKYEHDIPEVIRAFANSNEATKKRKREDNLRTWKWSEVIDVDALPNNVEPANVPKTKETTAEQHFVASENKNVINLTLQEPVNPIMAAESDVPQLVDKKGGSYSAIAPRLELGKFNKWKKRMLCYLNGIEPYYIQCIKDGLFQLKTAEGANKPKAQWSNDERRVVNQDQRLKAPLYHAYLMI
ncbi:hypothetical protein Tco_0756744 [Tanacetum coccineum]